LLLGNTEKAANAYRAGVRLKPDFVQVALELGNDAPMIRKPSIMRTTFNFTHAPCGPPRFWILTTI
jgi:hypothetical protein